jgi:hypothetical protein
MATEHSGRFGLAGGALAIALIEELVAKRVLTAGDAEKIIDKAIASAGLSTNSPSGNPALQILGDLRRIISRTRS